MCLYLKNLRKKGDQGGFSFPPAKGAPETLPDFYRRKKKGETEKIGARPQKKRGRFHSMGSKKMVEPKGETLILGEKRQWRCGGGRGKDWQKRGRWW